MALLLWGDVNSKRQPKRLPYQKTDPIPRLPTSHPKGCKVDGSFAALKRLDSGNYGECAECGEDIDERRLEAVPYATLCITCANARA